MERNNDVQGVRSVQSVRERFEDWTTFQRYWHAERFVAHDERKVPYIGDVKKMKPLQYASATDPSTWRKPSEVFRAISADKTGTLVGIGYVLNGDGTVCIDLDKVVDEHGNITPEAQQILERFPNTYAEYSRSERGIHIWLHTSRPLPEDGKRTNGIEIYQNKRYIAITMNILPNRPQHMADYTDELHKLYHELFGSNEISPPTPADDDDETYHFSDSVLDTLTITAVDTDGLDDEQIIERILHNPDYNVLWNGDKLPRNPSQSEADYALASILLWYTDGDIQRTRNLFFQSKRVLRDKIRKRPELVDRAINAAYPKYLQRKAQKRRERLAPPDGWDITQPFPCTDDLDTYRYGARVCKAVLGSEIMYLYKQDEWMVYNPKSGLWESRKAHLVERVCDVLEEHYHHLAEKKLIGEKELDRQLRKISNGDAVKKVIEWMEMMSELHGEPDDFNKNPMLIPLQNGVYDLTIEPDCVDPDSLRRKFRPYRPDDFITHAFAANYNPNANGDYWIHALEQWCWDPATDAPDTELIEYLWHAIGYTFTGCIDEQAMFIIYGPGGNGKSTLVGTIARTMGNHATTMLQNLFVADKNTSVEPARQYAPLRNRRMVVHPELPANSKLDTTKIKRVVSNEELPTRRLYEEEKLVYPTWKIWCTANDIPEITDQAAWRRIRIIPFRKVFTTGIKTLLPVGQLDPKLPQKLWAQRDYLATQACHYAARWAKKAELPQCSTVAQATDDVHRASDPFEDWFQQCVEIDPAGVVLNNEAYEHYKKYVESVEQSPLPIKKWAQRMAQKRVPVVQKMRDGKRLRYRTGIKLNPLDN